MIFKNKRRKFLYQYLTYYFFILIICLLGCIFIFTNQIKTLFQENLNKQVTERINIISNQFTNNLSSVQSMHYYLFNNPTLVTCRYNPSDINTYSAYNELLKYSNNDFVNSVIYLDPENDVYLSTKHPIRWNNTACSFYNATSQTWELNITPHTYIQEKTSHLINLQQDNKQNLIIFFTPDYSNKFYLFYVLDSSTILSMLKDNLITGGIAVALIDSSGNIAACTNYDDFKNVSVDYSKIASQEIHSLKNNLLLQTGNELTNGYRVAYLFTNEYLTPQIHNKLLDSLFPLLIITFLAITVIFIGMRHTWYPLEKLIKKYSSGNTTPGLKQLDQTFTNICAEHNQLINQLSLYQESLKETIMKQINLNCQIPISSNESANIDNVLDLNKNHNFFVCYVKVKDNHLPLVELRTFFVQYLNTENITLFPSSSDSAFYLIDYVGNETYKNKVLENLLSDLYASTGTLCSMSNGSSCSLEIPVLFQNAIIASNDWAQNPVCIYSDNIANTNINKGNKNILYPFPLLKYFTEAVNNLDFTSMENIVSSIFEEILYKKNPMYLKQCVIIDILTTIHNILITNEIPFTIYSNIYNKIRYDCQELSSNETILEIQQEIQLLLQVITDQLPYNKITPKQLLRTMTEYYCDPNFSIAFLADKFQVSIAYMSFHFQKAMSVSFSECLWNMRRDKAIELLTSTNASIDEISTSIGYLNVSSFRRRFKQETGETPSSYRKKH